MANKLSKLNAQVLESLGSEQEKQAFLEGLKALNMANPTGENDIDAFRESVRKLCPDFTNEQIETFIRGR